MKINESLNAKLLLLVIVPVLLCTTVAVLIASSQIKKNGEQALKEKSEAILSRMEAVRTYTAGMGMLQRIMSEFSSTDAATMNSSDKELIKGSVPIIASWRVGAMYAEKDNYHFKIASVNAREAKNEADKTEQEFIKRVEKEGDKTITYIDEKNNSLWVMRPVFLKETEGCLLCHGNPSKSISNNGRDVLGYEMENMKNNDFKGLFIIKSDLDPVQARANRTILIIAVLGLLISVVAIFIGIAVVNRIISTISLITQASKKISEGHLDVSIEVNRSDELGHLADYINVMVSKIDGVVLNVKEVSKHIAASSNILNVNSQKVSEGANNQASSTEEVSASMEEMAANVEQNTENSQQTERISVQASNELAQTGSYLKNTVESMKEIEAKVSIISEIAFQTNILALNATVEAAHAGKHGQGFAVVAKEVRTLAEKSKKAADEINTFVKTTVAEAVRSNEFLNRNVPEIKKTVNLVKQIAAGSAEQSSGINQINSSIQLLNNVTQINSGIANEMSRNSEELSMYAEKLTTIIDFFKDNNQMGRLEE